MAEDTDIKHRGAIVVCVMLATIMQALDTTIANVALPHMQGSLNAVQDQISWVLTSYIIAAAIMTPMTGFLANRMGRKKLFLVSVAGFTISSILCGIATTLPEMVIFRLFQGIFGAALVPLSQSVLLDIYPKEKHGSAMAMWGVGVMLGPILGPSLGGWLTENYNWRWVFYINVPIGIVALLGIMTYMKETVIDKTRKFDALGFTLLSLSIGGLQLFLDRGESQDWFSSTEIMFEFGIMALAFYLFLVHMFTATHPFIEPGLFKDRNYSSSLVFMFIVGIILLSTMALMPPFLQSLKGYPVITTGMVLAPRGIGTMAAMMLAGKLMSKVDIRALIFFGLALTAFSLWQMANFNLDVSEATLIHTGLIQGFGMGFVFVPLSTIAYATLAPHYRNEATALFSLVRNIGSSIGISIMIVLVSRNTQISHADLTSHLTPFSPALRTFDTLTETTGTSLPVMSILNSEVTRQAAAIAYLNDFRLMMYITLAAIPLLAFMKVPKRSKEATVENAAMAME